MGDPSISAPNPLPANFETRLTAMGSATTLLSFFAGQFTTGYKTWGFALALFSMALSLFIFFERHHIHFQKGVFRFPIYALFAIISCVSALMMFKLYFRPPPPPPAPVVQQVQPAPTTVIQKTYSSSTTGINSPVINGDGGTYNIGGPAPKPSPKAKKTK